MVRDKIIKALEIASGVKNSELEIPEKEVFGDYTTNVALQGKNPKELPERIKGRLLRDEEIERLCAKVEIAGPGFINFWLKDEALLENLASVLEKRDKYGTSNVGKGKTILVEYSSPNIAKRFGIGHLRSTIIGQSLYNLFKALGYNVIGENHLGDWGTQFGVLLRQIANYKLQITKLDIDKLEEFYVQFNKEAEGKPELWEEARSWFKKLEEGDKEARKIWQAVRNLSLDEFERIYTLLGVEIDHAHGESFYEDKMPSIVKDFREKGLAKKSAGAEIVEFPKELGLPPVILVKSDGTTTYFTRDLAAIKFRLKSWNPEAIIYEVGSDQVLHFKQVFASVKLMGWIKNQNLIHIAHGLVRFREGKMSTRRGITVKLEEVLDESIERAKKIIEASETGRGLNDKQKEDVAKAVGIAAVKYFDLMHTPQSDIIFDWNKVFVLEGNSGPYLQYTVARTNSVLAKIKNQKSKIKITDQNLKINKEEVLVLRTIVHFPEIIEIAARNYSPNQLTNYLFDLAQKYNSFYNKHRILDSEVKDFRLALTAATGQVLKNGLGILGIETPERM